MGDLRYRAIAALLGMLRATGVDRALAPVFRGRGVILTMHHVRPGEPPAFAPNRILEITPEFLDALLGLLAGEGFEVVSLDEVPARLRAAPEPLRPFAVLTFDDGYRDNVEHALPVLRRHRAPFTVFATTGFADGCAPLWWLDLEEAIARQDSVEAQLPGGRMRLAAATPDEKKRAFDTLYWALRSGPEDDLRRCISMLAAEAGIDPQARTRALCLDWDGLRALAAEPLATIGAHTLTHPMLAKHGADFAEKEMAASKTRIERELGVEVRHLSYPVGDPGSAGPREFTMARALGFDTAVTTRPGMLFADHATHMTALPRISVNGLFQKRSDVATLLSGLPTALQNRGRRLNVA